jgi:hypothetical protein
MGEYKDREDEAVQWCMYYGQTTGFLFHAVSVQIMYGAAKDLVLQPHLIYKLMKSELTTGILSGIDYGILTANDASSEDGTALQLFADDWVDLLTEPGNTPEEIIREAWMGRGRLWYMAAPNQCVLTLFI